MDPYAKMQKAELSPSNRDDEEERNYSTIDSAGNILQRVEGQEENTENLPPEIPEEKLMKPYPQDIFSFVGLCRQESYDNHWMLCLGYGLWVFFLQTFLLTTLVLNSAFDDFSSVRPADGDHAFLPEDVDLTVRVSQMVAVVIHVLLFRQDIVDVTVGLQFLFSTKDGPWMMLASVLRAFQGMLGCISAGLLIVTAPTVKEVVLSFTAVGFVHSLDKHAFVVASEGRFGAVLERTAKSIQRKRLPVTRSDRKKALLIQWAAAGMIFCFIMGVQIWASVGQAMGKHITDRFIVEFEENTDLQIFDGCYERKKPKISRRFTYWSTIHPELRFEYCWDDDDWVFHNKTEAADPCVKDVDLRIAVSSKTTSFDIESTFGRRWFLKDGRTTLDKKFNKNPDKEECEVEVGDSKCDSVFNKKVFEWDGGDCCVDDDCQVIFPGADGKCDTVFNTEAFGWDGGDCCSDETCQVRVGDGKCDSVFNMEAFGWDAGDCCADEDCQVRFVGADGECDSVFNTERFGWDGGDCCANDECY